MEEAQAVTLEGADVVHESVEHLERKANQVYVALISLTDDESNDIVTGAGHGNGLEAWRKLHRRWDPSSGSRKRNLLSAILDPGMSKIEELAGHLEKWLQQVQRYTRRKDASGHRKTIDDEILIASL